MLCSRQSDNKFRADTKVECIDRLSGACRASFTGICCLFAISLLSGNAHAQPMPGDPRPDVNIIGPTKDVVDIRDEGLKQQNEPACAIRPGDSDCIICFFNDYRTVDIFGHGDAWIGEADSCDAGFTWTSRIVPGHPLHVSPIDATFAADPRAIAIPGMTILGFIGGHRDQDRGVLAVQHWLEINKDDFDRNEPGRDTHIVDLGTEGRFIDKPDFLGVLDAGNPQDTVTIPTIMENTALGTITRDYPAGTLYAAYAVFTGSSSVKLLVKRSKDWGWNWPNKSVKLSEGQNLVSGISLTVANGIVMAMWRQALDVNDLDGLYYAFTKNGGNSWSKAKLLTDICKFDQASATLATPPQVTFRTNDFPWLANDGKNIYAFYTERAGDCQTGTPKIVMQYTGNGTSWSSPQQIDDSVEAGPGAQFMPAAFGARGKVQVAWYDTRREEIPVQAQQPFVADYIPSTGVRVNRIIDVYTARVTSDSSGNNVQVSESARVSQYRSIADASDPGGPKFEIEASFGNAMMYSTGFLAFLGDYIAVAGQEFRENGTGGWEANYSALPPPASNLTDFFIAYTDHRDVRGDVLFGDGASSKPYTPPDNVAPMTTTAIPAFGDAEDVMLAGNDAGQPGVAAQNDRRSAEGVGDTFTDPSTACVPDQDRTRNANIYGSLVRDDLRISTPAGSRPLSGILRAFPFSASNVTSNPMAYRLYIASQPGADPLLHRASFRQKPDRGPFIGAPPPELIEDVLIDANSALARTIFVVSPNADASVDVQIFDGVCAASADSTGPFAFATDCNVLGSITFGGTGISGALQQPDYQSSFCDADPTCNDVNLTELHNPLLENPLLENPLLENPLLENPLLENPELEAPLLENPLLENPLLENFGFENPLLENPLLENPLLENPLLENPLLENPLLENPLLENSALAAGITYMDITAAVTNDGNVATAYNFDVTASGLTTTGGGDVVSQLILWKQYVYGTSRDCEYRPEARNQVITTINQPNNTLEVASIEEPFNGEASMLLVPGETGYVTYRFFGTLAELASANVDGFTTASQAANCAEFDDVVGPPPGQEDDFYSCEADLADNRELILIDIDSTGPTFDGLMDGDVIPVPAFEANAPGGACIDPVASGFVSASDDVSAAVTIDCVNAEGDAICIAVGESGLSIPVSNLVLDPGPSPMTCTASDEIGNETIVQLFMDVPDTSAPFFTGFPANPRVVNADSLTGTATLILESGLTAADADGVDASPAIFCESGIGQVSGDAIPAGIHPIDCTATDASGNFATYSYTLEINDVTFPVISLTGANPQAIEAGIAYSELGATASDNVGVVGGVVIDAAGVDTGTPGDYMVTYTARDAAGNSTTAIRNVEVRDTIAPEFPVAPADVIVPAAGVGGAIVNFPDPAVTDNASAAPTVVCIPASGALFPIGTTPVTCRATDGSGNFAEVSFDVVVQDTIPPDISNIPIDIVQEATASGGAIVTYNLPDATDNASATVTIDCQPPTGSIFPVGMTTVTCTATDESGNSAQAFFEVIVQDTTAPVVTLNGANPITLSAGTAYVEPGATATDNVGVVGAVNISGAVNIGVPGAYTITYTAMDAAGNSSSIDRTVNIVDDMPPVVTVPAGDVFVLIQNAAGAVFDYSADVSVFDAIDPSPTLSCIPASGSVFAPGDTTVTCTGTDASGNSSTEAFIVTVGYGGGVGIKPNKRRVKAGSSNQLTWAWQDESGNNIDSSGDMQLLSIVDCNDGTVILDVAGDPGSSGFRIKSDLAWEFNWQSDDAAGNPLPKGQYCASVTSDLTGQMLSSPVITLR